jgi:lipid II:glycine glycyltransferase (peptidoglycan interpeptide bridge formation enzyme)
VKTKNIQPGKTLVVDLVFEEEALLAGMHPKTRYNIRLAQKHGVRVEKDLVVTPGHGLYFQEAVELIVATAVRQGYKGHSKKYYESLVDFFAKKNQPVGGVALSVYKALYQNRLLASAIMLDFGSTRTYLFGGSSEEDKQVMAPYALHWQAMLDGKAAGLKFYDFWGLETASGKTQGFARFKQGFGGKAVDYTGAYDARFSKAGYAAYCLARFASKLLGK